jgi:Reverse transcriptase (RNA-dependent DNA polymerase)
VLYAYKSSAADPIPVSVLKQLSTELAPYLTDLFCRSIKLGYFPLIYKSAFITPRLTKVGLDTADAGSYRPISNLTVISKLLERLVCHRLFAYLQSADLLPTQQSAYRPNHSTETAMLRVLSNILQFVDQSDVAALVLFDLSSAFDTVDHSILLRRLEVSFGLTCSALELFRSYITGRTQYTRMGTDRSFPFHF